MKKTALILLSFLISVNASASEKAQILTTLKPLHSLILNITKGSGENVDLLVKGTNSPHGYHLKPSQVEAINNAEVIFYIDDSFETFLYKALKNSPENVDKIALSKTAGIKILPIRSGGLWEEDEDEKEEQVEISNAEGIKIQDMHIFLSPNNAKIMAGKITDVLSKKYPDKKDIFTSNFKALSDKLDALDNELKLRLSLVEGRPFIVFHDAFQYFEKAYGLKAIGSITLEPDEEMKPKRLGQIQQKINSSKVVCAFTEPQFSDRIVKKLITGSNVKTAALDPEAISMEPSEYLYFEMMHRLATNLEICLK